MVRPERVELSTFSLGMKCSIHLSYGRTRVIIADFCEVSAVHLAVWSSISSANEKYPDCHLLFRSPFLMFLSLVDLFTQATRQGNGWTLAKTTATTRKLYPTTL